MTTPSQPKVESGRPSTSMTTSSERSRDAFSTDASLSAQVSWIDLVVDLDAHAERHALFDLVVAGERARDGRRQIVALCLGEEPDVTEIDAEQRGVAATGDLRRAQDGAVAAQHDHELELVGATSLAENGERRRDREPPPCRSA